jgi:hypothetical protein
LACPNGFSPKIVTVKGERGTNIPMFACVPFNVPGVPAG